MINLENTTFIIPIRIEHSDRYRNAKSVLGFLNANVLTNVFIFETSANGESALDFLSEFKNLKIKTWNIIDEDAFHRTKYLNIMLDSVDTSVVVNYDIDVILDPKNMLECQNMIMNGTDVIFPYELGMGQFQVDGGFDHDEFRSNGHAMDIINSTSQKLLNLSECGHCIFFNTALYRGFGGENENFISYGPEDKERMERFKRITSNLIWRPGERVYHFEHHRGSDSWITNPYFQKNWDVFNNMTALSDDALFEYYKNPPYADAYKNIGIKK